MLIGPGSVVPLGPFFYIAHSLNRCAVLLSLLEKWDIAITTVLSGGGGILIQYLINRRKLSLEAKALERDIDSQDISLSEAQMNHLEELTRKVMTLQGELVTLNSKYKKIILAKDSEIFELSQKIAFLSQKNK